MAQGFLGGMRVLNLYPLFRIQQENMRFGPIDPHHVFRYPPLSS